LDSKNAIDNNVIIPRIDRSRSRSSDVSMITKVINPATMSTANPIFK
jgi:hypothetical protein